MYPLPGLRRFGVSFLHFGFTIPPIIGHKLNLVYPSYIRILSLAAKTIAQQNSICNIYSWLEMFLNFNHAHFEEGFSIFLSGKTLFHPPAVQTLSDPSTLTSSRSILVMGVFVPPLVLLIPSAIARH